MWYLFSKDCIKWGLLTPPTKETMEKAKLMKGRFTGDPSSECEHRDTKKVGDTETEEEEVVCCLFVALLQ